MDKQALQLKIGQRVAQVREEKGISQSELARLSGKDRQSIHRLEKGQVNISLFYLYEIALALKVGLGDLVE